MVEFAPALLLDEFNTLSVYYGHYSEPNEKALAILAERAEIEVDEETRKVYIADIEELTSHIRDSHDVRVDEAALVTGALGALVYSFGLHGEDHVLGIVLGSSIHTEVYSTAQAYFNDSEVEGDSALAILAAMALPYPDDVRSDIKPSFRHNETSAKAHNNIFGYGLHRHRVRLARLSGAELEVAFADWALPEFGTIGNCACLGVSGDVKSEIMLHEPERKLYDLFTHNVDSHSQALSFALGLARVSSLVEAAGYANALDELDWQPEESVW